MYVYIIDMKYKKYIEDKYIHRSSFNTGIDPLVAVLL